MAATHKSLPTKTESPVDQMYEDDTTILQQVADDVSSQTATLGAVQGDLQRLMLKMESMESILKQLFEVVQRVPPAQSFDGSFAPAPVRGHRISATANLGMPPVSYLVSIRPYKVANGLTEGFQVSPPVLVQELIKIAGFDKGGFPGFFNAVIDLVMTCYLPNPWKNGVMPVDWDVLKQDKELGSHAKFAISTRANIQNNLETAVNLTFGKVQLDPESLKSQLSQTHKSLAQTLAISNFPSVQAKDNLAMLFRPILGGDFYAASSVAGSRSPTKAALPTTIIGMALAVRLPPDTASGFGAVNGDPTKPVTKVQFRRAPRQVQDESTYVGSTNALHSLGSAI